jgi:hypothetical protein
MDFLHYAVDCLPLFVGSSFNPCPGTEAGRPRVQLENIKGDLTFILFLVSLKGIMSPDKIFF